MSIEYYSNPYNLESEEEDYVDYLSAVRTRCAYFASYDSLSNILLKYEWSLMAEIFLPFPRPPEVRTLQHLPMPSADFLFKEEINYEFDSYTTQRTCLLCDDGSCHKKRARFLTLDGENQEEWQARHPMEDAERLHDDRMPEVDFKDSLVLENLGFKYTGPITPNEQPIPNWMKKLILSRYRQMMCPCEHGECHLQTYHQPDDLYTLARYAIGNIKGFTEKRACQLVGKSQTDLLIMPCATRTRQPNGSFATPYDPFNNWPLPLARKAAEGAAVKESWDTDWTRHLPFPTLKHLCVQVLSEFPRFTKTELKKEASFLSASEQIHFSRYFRSEAGKFSKPFFNDPPVSIPSHYFR